MRLLLIVEATPEALLAVAGRQPEVAELVVNAGCSSSRAPGDRRHGRVRGRRVRARTRRRRRCCRSSSARATGTCARREHRAARPRAQRAAGGGRRARAPRCLRRLRWPSRDEPGAIALALTMLAPLASVGGPRAAGPAGPPASVRDARWRASSVPASSDPCWPASLVAIAAYRRRVRRRRCAATSSSATGCASATS